MQDEQTYCTVCHGRGLDNKDRICKHCNGTGYEPEQFYDIHENND